MTAPFFIFVLKFQPARRKNLRMLDKSALNRKTSDLFGLLLVGVLVLYFCRDILLAGQVPFFRDLSTYFYPLRFALYESYNAGKIPLWNRHMAMGFPFLADFQSGVFYPPHIFLALFPFFTAVRALFIWHFLIAGLGTYLLFRHWHYPLYLSITGTLLFTIGGTTVALSNLLNHFQTGVWLPWMILCWERLLLSLSWKKFLALVLIAANAFLAGSPEIFALSTILIFLAGLRVKASVSQPSYGKLLVLFVMFELVVLGLVMVQALPTAELFFESRRQQPIPPQEALYWSLNPVNLVNLFFVDKIIDPSLAVGMRPFFSRDAPFLVSYYLGAFSFFGIVLWCCFTSRHEKVVLLTVVSISLIIAFGSYTPVYPFLYRTFPIIGAVRFPEKFFFFTFAILVYMAVRGVRGLLHDQDQRPKNAYIVMGLTALAWSGLYIYLRFDIASVAPFVTNTAGLWSSVEIATIMAGILSNVERQLILSAGFFLLLLLAKAKIIRQVLFNILFVLAVFIDLAWAHKDLLFTLKPDFVQQSPRILQRSDTNHTSHSRLFYYPSGQNLHPGSISVAGRPTFKDATALNIQNLLPNTGILYGLDYMQEIDALGRKQYVQFLSFANSLDFDRQLRLLRLCNVGYLVSFRELSANGISLAGRFPQYYSWLYKISGSVPRAYVVNKSKVGKDSASALGSLSDPEFEPTQEVVVENNVTIKPNRPLQATATIVRYEDTVVVIHVNSNDDGVLVMADSYYPGWHAHVDGKQTKILRANHFFRGVSVLAGRHVIEFKYDPQSFKLGLLVSLLTVFCILVISVSLLVRRSKDLSHQPNPSKTTVSRHIENG